MKVVQLACVAVWVAFAPTVAAAADLAVVGTGDGLEMLRAVGAAFTVDHPETSVHVPPRACTPAAASTRSAQAARH